MKFLYEENGDGFLATLVYSEQKTLMVPAVPGVTDEQQKVLNYIRRNPGMRIPEFADKLGISVKTVER